MLPRLKSRQRNVAYNVVSSEVSFYNCLMRTEHYYQKCLKEELNDRMKSNPRYSIRAFSRFLDINPSTLSRVLKGEKRLSIPLSKKILTKLELEPLLAKKFISSVAESYQNESVKRVTTEVKALLREPREKGREKDLTPDVFKIISDWYHYGILQLIETETAKTDVSWIARQLGLTELETELALNRLLELEMIVKENHKFKRTVLKVNAGDPALTTVAHKKRIRQVTEKSLQSLENDPIALRNHTTMTMAIDPEQLPLAKEMIDEFMDKLSAVLETKKKNVYELQINLFPLQRMTK